MSTQASGIVMGYGEDNKITKDNKAELLNFIIGHEYGVVSDNAFNASIVSGTQGQNGIKIGTGTGFAYGYFGRNDNEVVFDMLLPSAEQYWIIYAEFDCSHIPNTFKLKSKNNGRSQNIVLRQDVLSGIKTGVFEMPLWLIKLTSTGIQSIIDRRVVKNGIMNVEYAETTHSVSGHLGMGVRAETQPITDNSKKVATTAFVHNVINQ